jgi:acyl carrier protein
MAVSDEQILVRLKKICAEVLKVNEGAIVPESRFKEDLGADSLDTISLLMALEDEFKSAIPDEEAVTLLTVKDVVAFIKKHPAAA